MVQAIVSLIMKLEGHVTCSWENENTYEIIVGKPVGMRPSVGHTVWEDNIKMYLGEICQTVDWA